MIGDLIWVRGVRDWKSFTRNQGIKIIIFFFCLPNDTPLRYNKRGGGRGTSCCGFQIRQTHCYLLPYFFSTKKILAVVITVIFQFRFPRCKRIFVLYFFFASPGINQVFWKDIFFLKYWESCRTRNGFSLSFLVNPF